MSSFLLRFQKWGEPCGGVSRAGAGTCNNIFGVTAGVEKEMSSQGAGKSRVVPGGLGCDCCPVAPCQMQSPTMGSAVPLAPRGGCAVAMGDVVSWAACGVPNTGKSDLDVWLPW